MDTLSAAWPPTSFPAESKWNFYGGSRIESFLIFSVAFDFLIESLGKKGMLGIRVGGINEVVHESVVCIFHFLPFVSWKDLMVRRFENFG